MAALPTTSEELTQFVRNVIIQQFGEAALVNVDKLSKHYPEYELLKTTLAEVKAEQQTVTSQLDQSFPKLLEMTTAAETAGKALEVSARVPVPSSRPGTARSATS